MGLDLTRRNLSWTLLSASALLVSVWFRMVPSAGETPVEGMPLGEWLSAAAAQRPRVAAVVSLMLALWNGLLLTRILSRNMVLPERTYLPLVLYPAMAFGCPFDPVVSLPALATAGLLIRSFDLTIVSFRRAVRLGPLFDASLAAGTALLVWSPSVVYLLLLPVALVLFKKGVREWIVAWIGYLLPMAVCSYVYWGMGHSFGYVSVRFVENLSETVSTTGTLFSRLPDAAQSAVWIACATATVLALFTFWRRAETMRTRAYKSFVYFLWILFFSLSAVAGTRTEAGLVLLAAPMAAIIPAYFARHKGWIPDLVYLSLAGSVVCYNVLAILGR